MIFKILYELLMCWAQYWTKKNIIFQQTLISKANLYDELNGGEKCSEADTQTL